MNTLSAVPSTTSRTLTLLIAASICLIILSGCKSQSSQSQMPSAGSPSSGSPSSSQGSPSSGSGSPGGSSPSMPSAGGSQGNSGSPGVTPSVSTNGPAPSVIFGDSGSSSGNPGSNNGTGGAMPTGGSPIPGSGGPIGGTDPSARDQGTGQGGTETQGDNNPWGTSSESDGDSQDSGLPGERGQQSDEVDFSNEESGDIFGDGPSSPNGGYSGTGTTTSQERVAVLDEELDGAMREYDDMVLKERAYVLGKGAEQGAEEQLEDFEEGELYDDVFGTAENETPATARGGDSEGEEAGGIPGWGANVPGDNRRQPDEAFPPPDDIPSGSDDDVVARQIREAAMYEKDPELREKLWDEYRKYKDQTN